MGRVKRKCLRCDLTKDVISSGKEALKEVIECPMCDGPFVDLWRIHKYEKGKLFNRPAYARKIHLDCEHCHYLMEVIAHGDALEDIEKFSEPCRECGNPMFTRTYIEKRKRSSVEMSSDNIEIKADKIILRNEPKEKYLTIEIENENDVPIIFYKGKRVEFMQELVLHWHVGPNSDGDGTTLELQRLVRGDGAMHSERTEERFGYHMD